MHGRTDNRKAERLRQLYFVCTSRVCVSH